MATKKKSKKQKVVDISKKRGDKKAARKKKKVEENKAAAPQQPPKPSVTIVDWLVDQFRGQQVATRILQQGVKEAQMDVQNIQKELQTNEELADDEKTKLQEAEQQLRTSIGHMSIQLHERAGIMWQTSHTLSTIDPQRFARPGQLPGLPSTREMPDMANLDPMTVEEQQRLMREAEERRKAEEEARKAAEEAEESDDDSDEEDVDDLEDDDIESDEDEDGDEDEQDEDDDDDED